MLSRSLLLLLAMANASCAIVMKTQSRVIYERGEPVGPPFKEEVTFAPDYQVQRRSDSDALYVDMTAHELNVTYYSQRYRSRLRTERSRKKGYDSMQEVGIRGTRNQGDLSLPGYCAVNGIMFLPGLGFSGLVMVGDLVSLPFRTWDTEEEFTETVDLKQVPIRKEVVDVEAFLDCGGLKAPFTNNTARISFATLVSQTSGWQPYYTCKLITDKETSIRFDIRLADYSEQSPVIRKYIAANQKQVLRTLLQMIQEFPSSLSLDETAFYRQTEALLAIGDQARYLDRKAARLMNVNKQLENFQKNLSFKEREARRRVLLQALKEALREFEQ